MQRRCQRPRGRRFTAFFRDLTASRSQTRAKSGHRVPPYWADMRNRGRTRKTAERAIPSRQSSRFCRQEPQTRAAAPRDLIERALSRRLIGPPAEQMRAMPKAIAREVVVLNFDDQLRPQRLPLGAAFRAPATRAARSAARKTRRLNQRLHELGDFFSVSRFEARSE